MHSVTKNNTGPDWTLQLYKRWEGYATRCMYIFCTRCFSHFDDARRENGDTFFPMYFSTPVADPGIQYDSHGRLRWKVVTIIFVIFFFISVFATQTRDFHCLNRVEFNLKHFCFFDLVSSDSVWLLRAKNLL